MYRVIQKHTLDSIVQYINNVHSSAINSRKSAKKNKKYNEQKKSRTERHRNNHGDTVAATSLKTVTNATALFITVTTTV